MNTFLVMWDMYGLEYLFNATEWHKQTAWAILAEKECAKGPSLNMMILRARYNSQRCYEIYSFNADEGVTEDWIRQAFKNNPQGIVDLIRKQGEKIYSDRSEISKQVIV